MGAFLKVVDTILFLFFMFMAIGAPILDAQAVLPRRLFPDVLVEVKQWFIREFDYYLMIEKPSFLRCHSLAGASLYNAYIFFNLYALLRNKSWFPTSCLIFGVSFLTAMTILSYDTIESGKASNKMIMICFHFMGLSILPILRGLLLHSTNTVSGIDSLAIPAKKK